MKGFANLLKETFGTKSVQRESCSYCAIELPYQKGVGSGICEKCFQDHLKMFKYEREFKKALQDKYADLQINSAQEVKIEVKFRKSDKLISWLES